MSHSLIGLTRQTSSPSAWALAARYRWTALATVAIAVLGWGFDTTAPGIDWDWNWVAALALAAREGLHFGDQVIWTHGPLGFLNLGPRLYYGPIALVAIVYQAILQLLLAGTVFLAARRSYPAAVAFVLALVVVTFAPIPGQVLGMTWCVLALTRGDDARRDAMARAFPVAIGVLAGIAALGKINVGVEVVLLATIALVTRPGRRRGVDAAIFAGALLATAGAGWAATGQRLGDVWPYLRYGVEIVDGYPAAMGIVGAGLAWHHWVALAILALGSALVWDAARRLGRRQRWGLAAVWVSYSYLAYKAGFVRHDDSHAALFMGKAMLAIAVLPVRRPRRWLQIVAVAVCVAAVASIRQLKLLDELDPYRNAEIVLSQARMLASDSGRAAARDRHARNIREHYRLPKAILDGVGTRTVAFWPHMFGDLVYAYDLQWRPLPVLEAYSAYTPALDEAGADMLSSPGAPERVVRSTRAAIDGRLAAFEAPVTSRAILCRYRQVTVSEPWQLLSRGTSRCGTPRVTATVSARWGESVEVPRPSRPGFATIVAIDGTAPAGAERLQAVLLRPDPRTIVLDGQSYRLIGATASEGLVLRVPRAADYPPPFALAPNPDTIAVRRAGGQPGGSLRYTFSELPIATVGAG